MSSHRYLTTTIEYYEYLMPESDETLMYLPYDVSNNYVVVPEDSCYQQDELAYNMRHMVQWYYRPAFIQYEGAEPDQCLCNPLLPQPRHEAEPERGVEHETVENVDPSSSQPVPKPKCKQNHVYQAEQGYLVEEPASESEGEEEEEEVEDCQAPQNTTCCTD